MTMYILEGHTLVYTDDASAWARLFESSSRQDASDTIDPDIQVSTVFLGIDHSWSPGSPPILFETMIFGGKHDEYQERYATWEEAERGHAKAVELAKAAL